MYPLFEAAVTRMADTVKPLLLETGIPDAPYGQAGTLFVVGRKGRARAVTCRHALRPDNLHPVCVFPSDGEHSFLPLKHVSFPPLQVLAEDFADLALIEIDIAATKRDRQGHARLLNLDLELPEWMDFAHTTEFVVLGYPRDRSYIDYEDCRIHSERVALYGHYVGPSKSAHIHTMRVAHTKGLNTFSGFSGGPVLSILRRIGQLPVLLFCGMAIQGSVQSQLVHFLDSKLIIHAADVW